MKAHTNSASR